MLFRTDPGEHRGQLGFKDAVLRQFEFLTTCGFRVIREDVTFVRYESALAFINVYHGRASYEVGVDVGRLDRPEQYGLDYMVALAGKDAWDSEGFGRGTMFQVSSREGVRNIVPKVARLVRKYGDRFLSGDPAFYDECQRANKRAAVEYEQRQRLTRIREDAGAAWAAKELGRVIELLAPVRSELTEVERKRLSYAEKHSAD